jgi:nucleotide-binding universal stress UspA family protein
MTPMHIVVWVVEGTWQGCVDAAVQNFPADAQFTVLHVTPSDVTDAADAASIGLFGRGFPGRKPNRWFDDIADDEAASLLAEAADRLGHPNVEMVSRRGRVEREVVRAVADGVDVLVVARDGDRSRLGPKSLGHATRFIVDHAPCAVMLVWPDETPGVDSIPPPKHGPKPPLPPGFR